jgi:hypothetical protein
MEADEMEAIRVLEKFDTKPRLFGRPKALDMAKGMATCEWWETLRIVNTELAKSGLELPVVRSEDTKK